ncbi:hypothetical protein PFISCL1PPCAC_4606, partial [Pristionchus fissidentatus]
LRGVPDHPRRRHVLHPLRILRFRRSGVPLLQGLLGSDLRDYGGPKFIHVRAKLDIPSQVGFRRLISRGFESPRPACCSSFHGCNSGWLWRRHLNTISQTTHLCSMIYPVSYRMSTIENRSFPIDGPSYSVRSPSLTS